MALNNNPTPLELVKEVQRLDNDKANATSIPTQYLKNATVNLTGTELTIIKQDDSSVTFAGGGGSTIGIKEKTDTPSAIDPFANYYTKNDVYTKAQTYSTNEVYNKTEINNKLAKAVTIWTGSVTSSGTLTLNSSLNNFRFIEFIGINASSEYYTQIVDVDVLKITTQANPYDFAGNTYDVNRYINLYYTNDTTLTLKNGNNMSLKIIKGII